MGPPSERKKRKRRKKKPAAKEKVSLISSFFKKAWNNEEEEDVSFEASTDNSEPQLTYITECTCTNMYITKIINITHIGRGVYLQSSTVCAS